MVQLNEKVTEGIFMSNNRGYWGTKYKDVLSGVIVLSVISLILSVMLICFKDYIVDKESKIIYTVLGLLIAVYLNVNYYLLIKRYGFIGSFKKFLYGFAPCILALVLSLFAVVI